MKSLLKPLMLGTALSTLGLCCTISYAAALKPLKNFDEQSLESNQAFTLKVVASQSLPQVFNNKNLVVSNILNKPLLSLTVNNPTDIKASNPVKKNEFFEVAAIFNDRLQQLLSYFDNGLSGGSSKKYLDQESEELGSTCRKSKI